MSSDRIDYERLMADYRVGLVDTLRGFGPATEFLELWVPDEDPVISLCNMIDAAGVAGKDRIVVFVGTKTAARLDVAALTAAAAEFGVARVTAEGKGLLIEVSAMRQAPKAARPAAKTRTRATVPAKARKIPKEAESAIAAPETTSAPADASRDLYAAALAALGPKFGHEGTLAPQDGFVVVESADGAAVLSLLIDPASHAIHRAAHRGAAGEKARAMLEAFCGIIEGLPLQEASDHGVIRLEYALRDRSAAARPVVGVITPEAADPAFRLPLRLVRTALADYRHKTGYAGINNTFDLPPSTEWLALPDGERRQRIEAAIRKAAPASGFAADDVEIVAIEYDVRVVVRLKESLDGANKQSHMMAIERAIKDTVEPRLELFQEDLKDANVLRRLSEQGKAT